MPVPHNPPMPPASRIKWTPGPLLGIPQAPSINSLAQYLAARTGPAGLSFEAAQPWEHGETWAVVMRIKTGQPIGILILRMYDGTPGLVDFAVDPGYRRLGVAKLLAVEAKRHGIDLRDTGAIWDGPLTDEGRALRDSLVEWAHGIYGPASWESDGGS